MSAREAAREASDRLNDARMRILGLNALLGHYFEAMSQDSDCLVTHEVFLGLYEVTEVIAEASTEIEECNDILWRSSKERPKGGA